MKVLFYNDPHRVFGGTESYWNDITHFLRSDGIEVHPLSFSLPVHHAFPLLPHRPFIAKFLSAVEQIRPDIIHLNHNLKFAASIHKALQIVRLPVVATVHDVYAVPFPTTYRNRFRQWLYPFRCAAHAYIIPSRAYFNRLAHHDIPAIHYIPHCIDHEEWTFNAQYATDAKHLLYAGRLEKQKGVYLLLRALVKLLKKDPAVHLSILGDGRELQAMKRFVSNYHMDRNVTFWGERPRQEMARFFQRSTLLVMPSLRDEMFGLTGLEAQACGLPVLASDLEGIREWCVHGQTGYTVPPGDAGMLANAIMLLLQQSGFRETLRQQARQQVINNFPVSHSSQALIRLYADLMDKTGTPLDHLNSRQTGRYPGDIRSEHVITI
jgi:glycogen(starch) synthase